MKNKKELELMAKDSIVKDNYMNDMSDEEKYHHRRGFIIGYQQADSEFNNVDLANVVYCVCKYPLYEEIENNNKIICLKCGEWKSND